MREHFALVDGVGDVGAARLGNDVYLDVFEFIAAAADDGGKGRDLIRVGDDFTDLALLGVFDVGA